MKLLLSLLAVSGIAVAAPATASTVLFDGFESPAISPGSYNYGGTDGAGAVFDSLTGVQSNGSAFGYSAAPQGTQTGHLQNLGSFSYTLSGLDAASFYTLSFFSAARPNYAIGSYTVSFNGTQLGAFTPTSTTWTGQSLSFLAGATSGSLVFTGTTTAGDANVGFDSIAVSVPEPATWAMMLMGFGMIGFAARRRQSVKTTVTYA